jgi:hypothetical protein
MTKVDVRRFDDAGLGVDVVPKASESSAEVSTPRLNVDTEVLNVDWLSL